MAEPLLEIDRLKTYFPVKSGFMNRTSGHVRAVDDISFTIRQGETFGLVGESGSGKSTVGRTIVRLTDKTDGTVKYKGVDLHSLSAKAMQELRPKIQLIFQDPYSSLNPRVRIGDAIGEALLDHGIATKEEVRQIVLDVLKLCGLSEYHIDRFPMNFREVNVNGSALPERWRFSRI